MNSIKGAIKLLAFAILPLMACSDNNEATRAGGEQSTTQSPDRGYNPQEMDVQAADKPSMPNAEYETIEFVESSSELTYDAQESLRNLAQGLDNDKPVLLTLRMSDEDTIDATEPTEQFQKLAPERVTAVKNFLQQTGLAIEQVKVDEAGQVANMGEDNALARGVDVNPNGGQVVVVNISTREERGATPHIPH